MPAWQGIEQVTPLQATASEWTAANPTLAKNQLGIESDTGKQKIGDGATVWSSLAYSGGGSGANVPTPTASGQVLTATGTTAGDYDWQAASGLPTAPAAVSKPLRLMGAIDDGVIRDFSSLTATAANAASPQTTPTYDGSGQIAEMQVLYFPEGWGRDANGKAWRYWMANCPYPGGSGSYENPSMIVSDDGATWQVPPGLTNPIVPPSSNADVTIFVDVDGTMYMYYLTSPDNQVTFWVYWMKSTDGITWTAPAPLFQDSGSNSNTPTVIYDGSKYWFYIPVQGSPNVIYYATGNSPTDFTTMPTAKCAGIASSPTHYAFAYWNGMYYAIGGGPPTNGKAYLGWSRDGINWTFGTNPILSPSASGWDSVTIYRCSFVIVESANGPAMDIWYAAVNSSSVWHVGYTRMSLGGGAYPLNGAFTTLTGNGAQGASQVPFAVQAAASQSGNLTEWRNSSGNPLLAIDPAGAFISTDGTKTKLLLIGKSTAYADSKASAFLEFGSATSGSDYVLFTGGVGHVMDRFGITANALCLSSAAYNAVPAPGTSDLVAFSTASGNVLSVHTDGSIAPQQAQASLAGTTAGTAVSSQPFTGSSYKKALVYLNGYENTTATAQTITFPVPFTNTPYLAHDDSGGATVSTTTLTLPASMGAPKTGWIVVEGF